MESLLGSAKTPTFPYENLAKDYDAKKESSEPHLLEVHNPKKWRRLQLKVTKWVKINYRFLSNKYCFYRLCRSCFYLNSIEIEDAYLRLDRDLEAFFSS